MDARELFVSKGQISGYQSFTKTVTKQEKF